MKIEIEFTGLPLSKLESLLNNGWRVNGVHIQSVQMDGTLKHGAVTTGGMVLWWQPEQERVIAPSVRSVAQQTLDALEKFGRGESSGIPMTVLVHNLRESDQYSHLPAGPTKALHQARAALLGPVADGFAHRCAVAAIDAALAEPKNQLDDINVADMGTPQPAQKSIPDGYVLVPAELTKEMRAAAKPCTTVSALWASIIAAAPQPAQQDPAAYLDAEINCAYTPEELDGGSAHGLIPLYAAPQQAQQDPDALHLAAMDLARKQMDRIEALEAEVTRFRTDAMNEKSARKAMEQQLAARVKDTKHDGIGQVWIPLTDEDRQAAFESMPDMLDGFMKSWGWPHFSKAVEERLRQKNEPAQRQPLTDNQKRKLWNAATIEQCSHENCYLRGISDSEAAHGITKGST